MNIVLIFFVLLFPLETLQVEFISDQNSQLLNQFLLNPESSEKNIFFIHYNEFEK